MDSLITYMQRLNSHIKTSFNFKLNSQDLADQAYAYIDNMALTETGNHKIPKKYSEALARFNGG